MRGILLDTTVLIDLVRGSVDAAGITQDLELATDNDRHFGMIQRLAVRRPY